MWPAGRSASRWLPPWSATGCCKARRRAALNRALHELRRPLQALALAPAPSGRAAAPGAAELALAALDDLDHEINGSVALAGASPGRLPGAGRVRRRALARSRRGGAPVARAALAGGGGGGDGRSPAGRAGAGQPDRQRDRARRPAGSRGGDDRRPPGADLGLQRGAPGARPARGRDPRRGHGLRVVASIAAAHGGRFCVQHPAGAWVAVLELPLAPTPVPAAGGRVAGISPREPARPGGRVRLRGPGLRGPGGRRRRRLPDRSREPARAASAGGRRPREASGAAGAAAGAGIEAAGGPAGPGAVRAPGGAHLARAGDRPRAGGAHPGRRLPARRPAPGSRARAAGATPRGSTRGASRWRSRSAGPRRWRPPAATREARRVDVIVTTEPGPGGGSGRTYVAAESVELLALGQSDPGADAGLPGPARRPGRRPWR